VESAFGTQIHNLETNGKAFYANATAARLTGPTSSLVSSVSGLSNFAMKPMYKFQVNPKTGKPRPTFPVAKVQTSGLDQFFTNVCFKSPAAVTLATAGASLPVGQHYGNVYDQGALECGWTPAQIQGHYGVQAGYKAGLDGTGETIVIVDGPTDPSVQDDLIAFSKATGLPPITSSNFQIIYPDGVPTHFTLTEVKNWDTEADLDIQWSHAIAPGAKIILLITPTEDWTEFEFALQYAMQNKLGNVVSNSYGFPEAAWGAFTLQGFDAVLKKLAASGIAVNFSNGDSGDVGFGEPNAGGALYPASSSFVTSMGGTSIGLPNGSGGKQEVGWGNNGTFLSFATHSVLDPPEGLGLLGGSGGGASVFIPKPTWQYHLGIPGGTRQ
jgi:subtilase family serine protease